MRIVTSDRSRCSIEDWGDILRVLIAKTLIEACRKPKSQDPLNQFLDNGLADQRLLWIQRYSTKDTLSSI